MSDAKAGAAPSPRPDVVIVTGDTLNQFVDEKLGKAQEPQDGVDGGNAQDTIAGAEGSDTGKPNPDPAKAAEEEAARVEREKAERIAKEGGPKEGDTDGSKVFFRGKWVSKHDFAYRLHVQTEAKTKEAQEKAEALEKQVREEREARQRAEAEAQQLKDKFMPPPPDDLGPKPARAHFASDEDFEKALMWWTAENTRREFAAQQHQKEVARHWEQRLSTARAEIPNFDEAINANANLMISDQMRDAIFESDVGAHILYRLASNPDEVTRLSKLTVARMLKEVGKIEAAIEAERKAGTGKKADAPAPQTPQRTTLPSVSQAPPPITPIREGGAPVVTLKGTDSVPSNWTFEDYKAARLAGRIK